MRLLVTTPVSVVVDAEGVSYVLAEDETGAFGICSGHADFLTALDVSVLTWRNGEGREHRVALRGGVLNVEDDLVQVATREAIGEDTLERLGQAVLERLRTESHEEESARLSAARLNVAAVRQLQRYLEAGRSSTPMGGPAIGTLGEEPDE